MDEFVKENFDNCYNLFVDTADRIGAMICSSAFWSDSRCNWIGRSLYNVPKSDGRLLPIANTALGPDLYNGTSGIALFLGYLYSFTNKKEYLVTAEAAIKHALSHTKDIPSQLRFAFYSGRIGIAYVAAKLGIILHQEWLLEEALDIFRKLAERKNKDKHLMDIISGNAGSIPALLEMCDIFDEKETFFDLALYLGNELISLAVKEQVGWSWDWRSNGLKAVQRNLTGFAHGAAGIGYCMLRLFDKTKITEFRDAAEQAFAYENHWFNDRYCNWPDFRITAENADQIFDSKRLSYSTAWCHGAPGIGLSRLYAYSILKYDRYLNDSQAALGTVSQLVNEKDFNSQSNFSLCHGLGGICETLLLASNVLNDSSYSLLAKETGIYGITKYGDQHLRWPCGISPGRTPSLMLGLSGIGYFYLRLANVQRIPSILINIP
jgi:lantibiotic biosynthesis protein